MSGCFGYFCVLNNALLVCCRTLDIKDNLMTTSPLTYWSFLYNAHYLTLRKDSNETNNSTLGFYDIKGEVVLFCTKIWLLWQCGTSVNIMSLLERLTRQNVQLFLTLKLDVVWLREKALNLVWIKKKKICQTNLTKQSLFWEKKVNTLLF